MAKEKSLKSGNKFGVRYGRKNRDKFARIENEQRKKHLSPFCRMNTVKRLASGIWVCKKTGIVFASKAYTVDQSAFKDARN